MLDRLARGPFDLLIVGGGITGAGLASLAASRGLTVALVEREDFGSGTSGATSKMLHGGLRYLQHGELRLVREALRERGLLLRALGTQRVQRTPFLLPLRGGRTDRLKLRFGTWLYQRMAGPLALGPRTSLSAAATRARVPLLDPRGLRGGILYFEGVVDDVLLTLLRVGEAVRAGAVAVNHVEARGLLLGTDGRATGVRVRDGLTGEEFDVSARSTVNTAGVWSGNWTGPGRTPPLRPSKGAHLLFRRDRLPLDTAVVLEAPGGRWVFALPYGPFTVVGTTETDPPADPSAVRADPEDVRYLLDLARSSFPTLRLGPEDILDTYAGLRPLLAGGADRAGDLSREDVVHRDGSGLITVVGGKLTTHRAMAERALGLAGWPPSGRTAGPRVDLGLPATGAWSSWDFPPRWEGSPCPGSALVLRALEEGPSSYERLLFPWLEAAVRVSGAMTLGDILERRFHVLSRLDPRYGDLVAFVADRAAGLLGWPPERTAREREDYLHRLRFQTEAVISLRPR